MVCQSWEEDNVKSLQQVMGRRDPKEGMSGGGPLTLLTQLA